MSLHDKTSTKLSKLRINPNLIHVILVGKTYMQTFFHVSSYCLCQVTLLCVVVAKKFAQIDVCWSETIQCALNSASANKTDQKILENNDTNKYLLHFHFNSILGGNSKVMILQFLTFCIYLFHAST